MLRNIEFLEGSTVKASDGDVGTVTQVYFDDEAWGVRYLVVETGDWLRDRQVLISPYAVSHSDPGSSAVQVKLTRQQVRDSPNIDAHKPVSRQHEIQYLRYYGYPTYWGGANVWGMGAYPAFDESATAALPRVVLPSGSTIEASSMNSSASASAFALVYNLAKASTPSMIDFSSALGAGFDP